MSTGIVISQLHAAHDAAGHPEHAARLSAVIAALDASGLRPALRELAPLLATEEQLLAVHSATMVTRVRQASMVPGTRIDGDTYTTVGSWDAARMAAGCAIQATAAVWRGDVANAFALMRPPGHHATPTQSMGFCLFNSIAVAAQHARRELGAARVAIVDIDVHHGNGSQDCFYSDPYVLFCSLHGYGSRFYPGTGGTGEIGSGAGRGTTLNAPLPAGTGDTGALRVLDALFAPALRRFAPDIILVSAGFDGHWADPLGPLTLSVAGYAALITRLHALATELCGGKLVLCLEGGYNLDALAACVIAALRVLLGQDVGEDPLGSAPYREPDITELVARIARTHPLLEDL